MKRMKRKLIIGLIAVLVVGLLCGKILIPTFGEYSEGERSGILQKLSSKGMFVKTYEGELALEGMKMSTDKSASSVFEFSVRDKDVAKQLEQLVGKKVTLHYIQAFHANAFDGDTDYFIDKVVPDK